MPDGAVEGTRRGAWGCTEGAQEALRLAVEQTAVIVLVMRAVGVQSSARGPEVECRWSRGVPGTFRCKIVQGDRWTDNREIPPWGCLAGLEGATVPTAIPTPCNALCGALAPPAARVLQRRESSAMGRAAWLPAHTEKRAETPSGNPCHCWPGHRPVAYTEMTKLY